MAGSTKAALDEVFSSLQALAPGRYTEADLSYLKALGGVENGDRADPTQPSFSNNVGKGGVAVGPLQMQEGTYNDAAKGLVGLGVQLQPWSAKDLKSQLIVAFENARMARTTHPDDLERQFAFWFGKVGSKADKTNWTTISDGKTTMRQYVDRAKGFYSGDSAVDLSALADKNNAPAAADASASLESLRRESERVQALILGTGNAASGVAGAQATINGKVAEEAQKVLSLMGLGPQSEAIAMRNTILQANLKESTRAAEMLGMYQDSALSSVVRAFAPQLISDQQAIISRSSKVNQEINQELQGIIVNAQNAIKAKSLGIDESGLALAKGQLEVAKAKEEAGKFGFNSANKIIDQQQQDRRFDQQVKVAEQAQLNQEARQRLAEDRQRIQERAQQLKQLGTTEAELQTIQGNMQRLGYNADNLTPSVIQQLKKTSNSLWLKLIKAEPIVSSGDRKELEELLGAREATIKASEEELIKIGYAASNSKAVQDDPEYKKLVSNSRGISPKDADTATGAVQNKARELSYEKSKLAQEIDAAGVPRQNNPYAADSSWILSDANKARFEAFQTTVLGKVLADKQTKLNADPTSAAKRIDDYDVLHSAIVLVRQGTLSPGEAAASISEYFKMAVDTNNLKYKFDLNGYARQTKYVLSPDNAGFVFSSPDSLTARRNAAKLDMLLPSDVLVALSKVSVVQEIQRANPTQDKLKFSVTQ